jgi:TetR/AcrR family fatty acid metabolism transcriptional regulator
MPKLADEAKEERRQALIDAARRCAARKGFAELTVEEVCTEAGVSKGSFYLYFDSKQAMLFALLDDDDVALDAAAERTPAEGGGVEGLRSFVRAMVRRGEDPATVQIRSDLWAAIRTDEALRTRFSTRMRERRRTMRDRIERSVDGGEMAEVPANALASILLALGDGLTLHAGLDPNAFRWTNVSGVLDRLLEGLAS